MISKEVARLRIARRIAIEFQTINRSMYFVNLGIGIPTMVADFVNNPCIFFQSENGMLGVGPVAKEKNVDKQLINASRQNIVESDGCSYFDSALSFGMIRGGRLDATVLGAYEVDDKGYIANWIIPNSNRLGVGGAMDLIYGAKKVIIAMQYFDKNNKGKVKANCSLPISGYSKNILVVTEVAVFSVVNSNLSLEELAPEFTIDFLRASTTANFNISKKLKTMQFNSENIKERQYL